MKNLIPLVALTCTLLACGSTDNDLSFHENTKGIRHTFTPEELIRYTHNTLQASNWKNKELHIIPSQGAHHALYGPYYSGPVTYPESRISVDFSFASSMHAEPGHSGQACFFWELARGQGSELPEVIKSEEYCLRHGHRIKDLGWKNINWIADVQGPVKDLEVRLKLPANKAMTGERRFIQYAPSNQWLFFKVSSINISITKK